VNRAHHLYCSREAVGDVRNVLDPRELPARLQAAGFERARVDWNADTLRFRAS
jgi:hypothetical protein